MYRVDAPYIKYNVWYTNNFSLSISELKHMYLGNLHGLYANFCTSKR